MRDRLLDILAEFVLRHPWLVVILGAAAAAVSIVFAATSLRLNANLDDLIARDRPFMVEYRRLLETFGDLESIIIVVDAAGHGPRAERVVDALLTRLRVIPDLASVHGAIEADEQVRIATRAMSDEQLQELAIASQALTALRTADAGRLLAHANAALTRLLEHGAEMPRQQQAEMVASAAILLGAIAAAAQPEQDADPLDAMSTSAPDSQIDRLAGLIHPGPRQYLRSDSGRLLFVHVMPAKDFSTLSVIEEPLRRIREAIAQTQREFDGIDIGLTGKPVLQYDEMTTSNADMTRASIIALTLCSILFMAMLGGVRRPLLAVFAFAMGAAWTYGFATVAVGQLNLLSLVFMLVLVGVGLDYGVHVVNRYQEALRAGASGPQAVRRSIQTAVRGNLTGALTSSIVFFMAYFTTFQGLRELGLIAGGGLLLCLIAMSVVFPALLVLFDRGGARRDAGKASVTSTEPKGAGESWLERHPQAVLLAAAIVTTVLLAASGSWRFEFNLLKLQAEGLESIEWEQRILEDSAAESWFGAAIADDQREALAIVERARAQPTIGRVRSIFDVIQPDTQERYSWREQVQSASGAVPAAAEEGESLESGLAAARGRLELIAAAARAMGAIEAGELADLARRLRSVDLNEPPMRARVDVGLANIARLLRLLLEGDVMTLREAMPAAVRDQFISPSGELLIMMHPRFDVWEYEPMRAFISDLRAVDPDATGVPITHFESLGEMVRAFVIMSTLALVAIIVLLAIDFRDWRDVALALAPLIVGVVWTVEAMGLLGLAFNLANFFALPMLIGLGVDSAVHILHRYHEGEAASRLRLGHTRRAVILTALTTTIGFGALIFAHHRGLRSLGVIMALGSIACLASSIMILPALLAIRERLRSRGRHVSSTPTLG